MKKYVPLKKQSKREQKVYHARQRGDWGTVVPVTRVIGNKKRPTRRDARRLERQAREETE